MAKVKIQGHASGTGILTVTAPNTSTDRTITLPDATGTLSVEGIPTGVIVMWSGAITNIPAGWVICDGTNSTPNLTDRFVIHADADSGGTNDVGDTGGSHTATPLGSVGTSGAHTLSTSEMPSHTHSLSLSASDTSHPSGSSDMARLDGSSSTGSTGSGGSHTHTGGTFTGSSTTVTPKYYALAYIMKS
jgi:hypothetical protein